MKGVTKEEVGGCVLLIIAFVFAIGIITLIHAIVYDTKTSSPVEEMYHRELVITLDSILDARFDAGCCEEVIDSDDISVPIDSFGRVVLPDNWK